MTRTAFREMTGDRLEDWVARGHRRRHFFPHRIYQLPKCGPDCYRLANWMSGERDPATMWELLLHAGEPVLSEFPPELFFDDDLQWHRQQFGLPGHLATVNVVVRGDWLHTSAHVSDLVQRIGRRREHKTRVETQFAGWDRMILNAVLDFAIEHGVRRVFIPSSEHALAHTDRERNVGPQLFERIYDNHPRSLYPVERAGDWWGIDVAAAAPRVVRPERASESLGTGRTICVFHDVERGAGHVDSDPQFAGEAERASRESLSQMLAIESAAGVRATYNVLGTLFEEVRGQIEDGGHCLAFHSYDHEVEPEGQPEPPETSQLDACRQLDYRLKGYRPPQSRIGSELTDANLLFHNFEWIASSPHSLGVDAPRLSNRLVRLPVCADDFELYRGMPYEEWEAGVLAAVDEGEFAAVGLHDCYGQFWLPHYERLLETLGERGRLTTLDRAAAEVTLASAA